ncbi:pre-peptidase C-terminal domain-containing protein, partial [Calothrix sp. CCY 0018]|uniref:pre-peptidase C-terminal domain-containing protein n=1 Tax=Calothrix sp. CCY 0018 TaxID=3103864 RepID=UPI0039C693B6
IDEGSTNASFTINIFDNSEPDTFLPATFDGLVEAVFQLKTNEQVDSQDLGDVGNLSDYTIDSNAATSSVLFADEESQLAEVPEPPTTTEPPATGLPLVSLNTGPDYLAEEKGTVSAHVFNITEGTIPEGGLLVGVNAPNLSEFDLDAISVGDGGEIVNVREDGFDILLTDFTVLVDLPVAADGESEGLETAVFTLEAGDGYEVNEAFGSGEFTIGDTAEEVPFNASEPNDAIPFASDIGLSPENPQVSIVETIDFEIGNRYQNEDGTFDDIDASEDVDLYKFELKAGDIIALDIESAGGDDPELTAIPDYQEDNFGVVSMLRLFDSEGNELAYNGQGQAPGEMFTSGPDPYIEFEASTDGTYYAGVSQLINSRIFTTGFPEGIEAIYQPSEPGSGRGDGYYSLDFLNLSEYELNVTLNPENPVILAEQRDRSNNTPPETIDLAQPGEPTVSLSVIGTTLDADNEDAIIANSLVEGFPLQGSAFVLTLETEGKIPEEGILVTVNSDIYFQDYFSGRFLQQAPFSPGAELVDVVTDDTGRETGIQLRIFEPNTFFSLNAKTQYRGELLEPETDGPEEATFFLEEGEGYGVNPNANQSTTTFYDNIDQIPEPTVIPEVSLSISKDELIEDQGTEATLNFNLSEAPSEDGVLIYVKGNEGILPQFDVLNADISGGIFPFSNFDVSGFYFKVTEQEASIVLPVFADPFEEGLQSFNLAVQEAPTYTINSGAGEVNFTIADTPLSLPEVSLRAESEVLVESENDTSLLTFNLTAASPSEDITVSVDAPNLPEFNVDAIAVTGGEITEISNTAFSLKITDITATVELPVASDGDLEKLETATFSLVETANSTIDPEANVATFTIFDSPEQVPVTEENRPNDTIAEAINLNLNPENTDTTVKGSINGLDSDDEFFLKAVDFTEDVDFYSFNLEAGDKVKIDLDSIPFEFERFPGIEQRLDSELRLFDADGNELASVNNGAAPDEEFSRDPYLEFTAEEAGSYYAGVSQLGNRNYDPNVEESGSGWIFTEIGVFAGEYELNVELASANVPEKPTTEPVFGSLEADIIEVTGTSQLIFGGDSDDFIDASIGSQGGNRIYAGSGDDTLILGSGDRLVGGEGTDKFFALSGGDNILTGGAGADQFWIATVETPEATNIITDFTSGEDVLGIAGLGIGFNDLSITQQEDNTLIAANGSDLAILQGFGANSLIADNFAFA